jgi:hypothetical protein
VQDASVCVFTSARIVIVFDVACGAVIAGVGNGVDVPRGIGPKSASISRLHAAMSKSPTTTRVAESGV